MYIQNDTGTKLVAENAIFDGYGFGVHAYAEAGSHLRNMTFIGNTSEGADGIIVRDNLGWARPVNERSFAFGHGSDNGALTFVDDYLTPPHLPITGAPPAQPIGTPDAIDPAEQTGTDFDVFVLRATCAAP